MRLFHVFRVLNVWGISYEKEVTFPSSPFPTRYYHLFLVSSWSPTVTESYRGLVYTYNVFMSNLEIFLLSYSCVPDKRPGTPHLLAPYKLLVFLPVIRTLSLVSVPPSSFLTSNTPWVLGTVHSRWSGPILSFVVPFYWMNNIVVS